MLTYWWWEYQSYIKERLLQQVNAYTLRYRNHIPSHDIHIQGGVITRINKQRQKYYVLFPEKSQKETQMDHKNKTVDTNLLAPSSCLMIKLRPRTFWRHYFSRDTYIMMEKRNLHITWSQTIITHFKYFSQWKEKATKDEENIYMLIQPRVQLALNFQEPQVWKLTTHKAEINFNNYCMF